MTLSDAVVAAVGEGRNWLRHGVDGKTLWVLVAHGELIEVLPNGTTKPFSATVEQQASDGWHVSERGPKTVRRRNSSGA